MNPNISGTTHALEASYDGGASFQEVSGVDNLSFDTTNEDTNRPFVDGTALTIQTQFSVSMQFRITYLNQVNLDKILGSYMYEAADKLDSLDTATVGAGGAMKLGLARTVQPEAIVRLRPRVAEQADKTLYFVNASIQLAEPDYEDGLIAVSAKITSEEAVLGDVSFTAG